MKNLNFHRVGLLIRHQIFSDIRKYRNQLLGLFIGIFATMFFILFNGRWANIEEMNDTWSHSAAVSVLIAGGVLSLISASLTFSPMNSKTKRITSLMLPATNLEKFVSYLTVSVVFYHLAFLVVLPLADLVQYVAFWALSYPRSFVTPEVMSILSQATPFFFALTLLGCIAQIATYVLGSAFFRRQPFILTTLLTFVANYALLILLFTFLEVFGEDLAEYILDPAYSMTFTLESLKQPLKAALIIGTLLWIVLCLSASYRMFRRANVIPSRHIGF